MLQLRHRRLAWAAVTCFAVYTATVSQNPPTGSLVDLRFKYRDPAAKGKPNTNCLDTSDPNRARADVCGASWSQTVTDP